MSGSPMGPQPPDRPLRRSVLNEKSAGRDSTDREPRPVVRRVRFATTDPEQGASVLNQVYRGSRIQVCPDSPFSMVQTAMLTGHLGVERARFAGTAGTGSIATSGTVRIGRVLGGRLGYRNSHPAPPARSCCRPTLRVPLGRHGHPDRLP